MANVGGLQLLPETRKKIEIVTPGENRIVVTGVVLLVIVITLSTGIYFYKNSIETKLASLDTDLAELEQQRNKQAEQNLILFNKQVSMLSKLLNEHTYWTIGLAKIEALTQPQVQFDSLTATVTENKLGLKAIASNYTTIARQIAAFLSDKSIKDITLSKVSTLPNGRLEFSMQIIFDRDKFLKKQLKTND